MLAVVALQKTLLPFFRRRQLLLLRPGFPLHHLFIHLRPFKLGAKDPIHHDSGAKIVVKMLVVPVVALAAQESVPRVGAAS